MSLCRQALPWVLAGLTAALAGFASAAAGPARPHDPRSAVMPRPLDRPNIVLIIADDQRWDTIHDPESGRGLAGVMPAVEHLLAREGVTFTNAFVSSPLCSPSRASLLSGGYYSHRTGVLTNSWPNGGARRFNDERSVATYLRGNGYRTHYIGKYLNDYEHRSGVTSGGYGITAGHYVPAGWDSWVVYRADSPDWYGYPLTVGASSVLGSASGYLLPQERNLLNARAPSLRAGGFPGAMLNYLLDLDLEQLPYIADFELDLARGVIEDATQDPGQPFLLVISTAAPHGPALPAPGDTGLFPDFAYRGRAWGEEDLGDKPTHFQEKAEGFTAYYDGTVPLLPADSRLPDEFFADQLRSLQGVDRTVAAVVQAVEADPNLARRTVFIYTSDHGLLWGEHRLVGEKKLPYEEALRVPLIIRYPGVAPRWNHQMVAADLDLGATLLHLGGFSQATLRNVMRTDGQSLLPALMAPGRGAGRGPGVGPSRRSILIQDYRARSLYAAPTWAGVRGLSWKYVVHDTLEEELYDLRRDPFEEWSLHDSQDPAVRRLAADLAALTQRLRGLTILSRGWNEGQLPYGSQGTEYAFQLEATGGEGPYSWIDRSHSSYAIAPGPCEQGLPTGLQLDAGGMVSGVPAELGCFNLTVEVRDSSISPQHDGPQRQFRLARIRIVD